jgi:hypothetical protein
MLAPYVFVYINPSAMQLAFQKAAEDDEKAYPFQEHPAGPIIEARPVFEAMGYTQADLRQIYPAEVQDDLVIVTLKSTPPKKKSVVARRRIAPTEEQALPE